MHEHAADLGGLVGAAQPALDARVGAARGAGAGQHRRQVPGAEADQRVVGVQHRDHHLADLAFGHRIAGAGAHDLDDHAFVDHQALARAGLIGNQADIGRGVALVDRHAAFGEPVAQAGRKGLAADQALDQTAHVGAAFLRLLDQDAQEARGTQVALRAQFGDGLQLLLGLAGAGREHRAADSVRARFHDERTGRHVVAEGVVHQVAGAKACREQGTGGAPVVARRALRLIDRAGAGVQARHGGAVADGGKAAEGILAGRAAGLLTRQQLALARDRQARQRGARVDGRRIHARQDLAHGRTGRLRVRHLPRQRRHQRRLTLGRRTRFQGIEEITHHMVPNTTSLIAACARQIRADIQFHSIKTKPQPSPRPMAHQARNPWPRSRPSQRTPWPGLYRPVALSPWEGRRRRRLRGSLAVKPATACAACSS